MDCFFFFELEIVLIIMRGRFGEVRIIFNKIVKSRKC